jgi:hypothetical protein
MKERFVERLDNYQFTYITLKIHSDVLNDVSPYFLLCALSQLQNSEWHLFCSSDGLIILRSE